MPKYVCYSLRERIVNAYYKPGESLNTMRLAKELQVKLDERGYIITDKQQQTNVKGVYAAGDITGGLQQVITACAEGAVASLSSTKVLGKQYPY